MPTKKLGFWKQSWFKAGLVPGEDTSVHLIICLASEKSNINLHVQINEVMN